MHIVNYKYRLYPNKEQTKKLEATLYTCKYIWNELLSVKSEVYQECNVSVNYCDLDVYITQILKSTLRTKVHSQVLQNVNKRLDKAFIRFFEQRNCGYPKFKSFISSFTYPQFGFKILSDGKSNKVKLSCIGNVKFIYHRPIIGKIKNCTIKKVSKYNPHWYVIFSVEQTDDQFFKTSSNHNNNAVGLDIGIKVAYALSDGTIEDNPHFLKKSKCKLRSAQRKLSRKVKSSSNYKKQNVVIAKIQEHIANKRSDWQFKQANRLVNLYHIIAAENISPKFMLKNHRLAFSATDMAWSSFFNKLEYEAYKYRTIFGTTAAQNTSQLCSHCGAIVEKDLSVRVHICPYCKTILDRDVNAACNILLRASKHKGFPSSVNLLLQ
jgi:putative transposase